jgi:hypothetical protein
MVQDRVAPIALPTIGLAHEPRVTGVALLQEITPVAQRMA